MAKPINMPQVGQDVETAVLVEWHKQENDPVNQGDIIATVESEKATFDVEAYDAGILLKRLYSEGDEIKVLTPIAWLGQPGEAFGEAPASAKPAVAEKKENAAPVPQSTAPVGATAPEKIFSSPSARRVAAERGVDLKDVGGTGPNGRIVSNDVRKASEKIKLEPAGTDDQVMVFTPMRAKIAERMSRSKREIPHFTLFTDVDMTELLAWRKKYNHEQAEPVSVTDLIVRATVMALREHPKMNAHVMSDRVILKHQVNIGVAVALPEGLAVPVIAAAESKNLNQLSGEIRRNAEAIRAGKMLSNASGSFTVTNLGMFAIDMFSPIINPPEAGILALGRAVEKPVVINGGIHIRSMMTAALACDHRAIDGAQAAGFLETIKLRLETPADLI
jgi:pyruvate dehydrogenase E2 component (dihydrolipoamide acetyltransferase)